MIIITLLLILVLLKIKLNFKIDITKEKDILIWYNWKNKRKYFKI